VKGAVNNREDVSGGSADVHAHQDTLDFLSNHQHRLSGGAGGRHDTLIDEVLKAKVVGGMGHYMVHEDLLDSACSREKVLFLQAWAQVFNDPELGDGAEDLLKKGGGILVTGKYNGYAPALAKARLCRRQKEELPKAQDL